MQTSSDRGMSYTSAQPISQPDSFSRSSQGSTDSPDMAAALWRYRWAVLLPAIAGAIAGFGVFMKTPETFRSTTQLMVESDNRAILDTMTGDLIGGVPSVEILQSQLFSDDVMTMAFDHERMQPFQKTFGEDVGTFTTISRRSLVLEPEVKDSGTAQALVVLLAYQHTNAELCEAAVEAFSDSLQTFFNKRQKSDRSNLISLIEDGIEKLPDMGELEQQYQDFRRDAPLAWNSEGEAINPHRERQLYLVGRRSELVEQLRDKMTQMAAVESVLKQSKDPLVALSVVSQLLGVMIDVPVAKTEEAAKSLEDGDAQLARIEVDQQLMPLLIDRNKFASELGANHPSVKQLDNEIKLMRTELYRIVMEQTERILELRKDSEKNGVVVDPAEKAKEAIKAVLYAAKAESQLLQTQINEVDSQIADENKSAIKLAKYEQENASRLAEIARNQELINELNEQMTRVSLTEEESRTRVLELTATTNAKLIGPNMPKMLGIGTFLGIALGAGLALLLEKNANTFRDPEEISQVTGAPVLTHVPFFKGRVRKPKKGDINPFKELDPCLVVLHQPASVAAEAIRSCRTSVFFDTANVEGGKVIQISSPLPGDGKTTVAGNLACSIAQSGKRVLAIDCDLRRPQLSDNFVMQDQLGLTNVLNGECDPEDAAHQTPVSTLRVMPSGPIPANPAEALTLPDMGELLELLREQYDYVILDSPPLLVVTDPSITATMADGVVMALRVRRKSKPNAKESVGILNAVGARLLGVVINNSDESGASDGYKGYGYYRYGRYTSRYYRRKNDGSKKRGDTPEVSPVVVEGRGIASLRKRRRAKPAVSSESGGRDHS